MVQNRLALVNLWYQTCLVHSTARLCFCSSGAGGSAPPGRGGGGGVSSVLSGLNSAGGMRGVSGSSFSPSLAHSLYCSLALALVLSLSRSLSLSLSRARSPPLPLSLSLARSHSLPLPLPLALALALALALSLTHTDQVAGLGECGSRGCWCAATRTFLACFAAILGKVDVRLPGKGNSNFHGARPVHQIITMIKWIRTSRLSIKNSLSGRWRGRANAEAAGAGLFFFFCIIPRP